MASRIETQFGSAKDLGNTYTQIGSGIASGHLLVLHLNVTNITAATVNFRAYIADSSWSSGEPTGSTKVAAIAFDLPISAGQTIQLTGMILAATQELVVRSGTATALDVVASGVDVTL